MIVADTTYTITASKITVKSNDVAALTKGYTCIPEMKGGKTYSITDISCDAGSIIKIDLFASQRLILKDATESRFVFADKQMKIYGGLFHEILNEYCKDEVIGDMIRWMEVRI